MQRVDWFRIMTDMKYRGLTLVQMSAETGIHKGTLQSYRTGTEPGHYNGELLLQLWGGLEGKRRDEAPSKREEVANAV